MKKITADLLPISEMTPTDVKNFCDWAWATENNMFETAVIGYPRTVMCRAQSDKPLLYIPLQTVLMYDAICHDPDLTPRQEALALWKVGEVVDQVARDGGYKEIYFICRDDRVSNICSEHGFVEVKNVRVLKRKP